MAGEISSIKCTVSYGAAATRPTAKTGYTVTLTGVKSISEVNSEPSQLDTTTFDNQTFRSYILGLIDSGGSVTLTANNTDTFQTQWSTLVSAAATAKTQSPQQYIWFVVEFPGLANAFYFRGEPVALGMNAVGVDEVVEVDAYVSLSEVYGWAAKPTVSP